METLMIDSSLIRLAFYEGSDGPRVVLFGPQEAAFKSLQQCFRQLAGCGEAGSIVLERLPWVFAAGGISLKLTSYGSISESPQQRLDDGIRKTHIGALSFEWKQTKEGWQDLVDLMQSLLDSEASCHQYLTRNPIEDAIVVL